jgi:cellobiose phosphorylase
MEPIKRKDFFDDIRDEYVVTDPREKKYQDNYLFNNSVFSYVTHTGMGYSRYTDDNNYTTNLIHGTIDNQQYEHSRMIYIRDNKTMEYWSVGWEPVCKPYDTYECRIGLNYNTILNKTNGVECKWTIFVPQGKDPVEMWDVSVTTKEVRDLSVYFFTEISLLTTIQTYGHDGYMSASYHNNNNAITVRKSSQALVGKLNAVSCIPSMKPDSYTCSRYDFVGLYQTPSNPIAVTKSGLSNSAASKERVCGAFQFDVKVEGSVSLNNLILGHNELEDINYYIRKYSDFNSCFIETQKTIQQQFNRLKISTGNESLDRITNVWNKQMILYGQKHCRWGIKGYRDVVQHSQGGLYFDTELSRKNFIECLRYQKSDGFSVRSFPVVYEDSKMHYSDSASWLIFAVTEYIKETGDLEFLNLRIPFLDEGEASVFQHLELIVDSLFADRGEHGFVRIHGGDWNDSLTHVGINGRGESVWLTMFLAACCLVMEELTSYLRQPSAKYLYMHKVIKDCVNQYAWDGEWYLRAFNDEGGKLGSKDNTEGKIFLNAQSWAIISGIADEQKTAMIKKSIDKYLLTDYGYILNYPTFTKLDKNIGRMTVMEPGTAENGSVYMHGNAFLIYALLCDGDSERAYSLLQRIQPDNLDLADKAVCPYIYGNCYYGPAHKKEYGKMEFSWITGSANWILQSIIELMLGIRRTYEGLVIQPHLSSKIATAEVNREFRGCKYNITIENSGQSVASITINGMEVEVGKPLPLIKEDGKQNIVKVKLI